MAGNALLSALEAAVRCLEAAGMPYALVGGAAMPAWGRIRSTVDADFLLPILGAAATDPSRVEAMVDGFRKEGFAHMERADRTQAGDLRILHFWFPVRPEGLSVRVDVLLSSASEHAEVARRAIRRRIDGFEVCVASCEDLILLKLAAGRPIDLADATELWALNAATLDRAYLDRQAARMGVTAALANLAEPAD